MISIEKKLLDEGYTRIMGLDEVGRGCLAGPVVAAGVILNPDSIPDGINDSKQLSVFERNRLCAEIKQSALFWTIQDCNIEEIDSLNILWASIKAMQKCENAPGANPDYLLIDGNRYTSTLIPHSTVVKGDTKSASIAAASIIAKVHRDYLMTELHQEYPVFNWISNVGYPTSDHYKGLIEFGYTRHHRKSFRLRTSKIYQEK
jgi:ribonuclease HII